MHAFRIFKITTAGVKCLCGSCKKPPRTSFQCSYIYKLQGRGEYSVWPASSVGRASGRYPGGHGFEPRSGRIFFSLCNN